MADELSAFLIKQTGIDECAEREEKGALRGAYGFVFKVTVQGVERIGKKLHSAYVNNVSGQEKQAITARFRNECVILSKLRHPNIVQFIGVHYGRRGKTDLTLIMECVSSDMHEFLEGRPNLPLPVKLSILLDVSYGLVYLHEWDPNTPIVHRDLTARNVLITDKCQAKIADLGMAKVVDIQEQMAVSHTQTPGQQFYMPPEALKEKASCTPKLDIFSFGHLTLFTVNQEFPKVYNVTLTMNIQQQGVIERLKRQRSLDHVGDDHCLYPVITDCLSDQPENRPTTRVLNNRMIHLSTLNPASAESVLEVFKALPSKTQRDEVKRLNSTMEQLYKHNKDQSKIVYQLRQNAKVLEDKRDESIQDLVRAREELEALKVKSVEDMERKNAELELAKSEVLEVGGDAFRDLLREAEDEKDKLREDYRKEIDTLKMDIESKVARFEDMKKRNYELELAKNEAVCEIAVARAEADIYKSDFLEERKDREKAQGALDAMKKEMGGQHTVFQEEVAAHAKTISELKQERNNLKKEFACVEAKYREEIESSKAKFTRVEAKLKIEISTSKVTIGALKSKVEEISNEKDDWRKKAKGKEFVKLKAQLKQSIDGTIKMTDQVERFRQEKKEVQKALSKAEARIKKLEKPQSKKASSVTNETKSKTLYEQERDRNQKLQEEIESLRDDIQHHMAVVVTLKSLVSAEQVELGDNEKTLPVSPTDHNKNSLHFENDPNFIASSGPVTAVQQNAPSRHSGEAGTGQYLDVSMNKQPGSLPKAPVYQVLDCSTGAGSTRQGRRGAQNRSKSAGDFLDELSKPDHDQQRRPPTLPMTQGRHPQDSAPQNRGTQQFSKECPTQDNIPPQGSRDYPPQGNNDYPLHSPQGYPPQNFPQEYRAARLPACEKRGTGDEANPKSAPQGHPQQGYHAEEKRDYPLQGNRAYPPQGRDPQQEYYSENRGRGVHSADIPMKNSNNSGMYQPEHGHDQRHSEPIRGTGPYPSEGEMARGRQDRQPQQQPPPSHDHRGFQGGGQRGPPQYPPSHPLSHDHRGIGGEGYGRQTKSQPQSQPYDQYDQYGAQPQGRQGRSEPKSTSERELPYQHQHQQPLCAGSHGDIMDTQGQPAGNRGSGGKKCDVTASSTENVLVKEIDHDIEAMAAVVQDEVSRDNKYRETQDMTPFDPNLVCPMCGKEHCIGEVQKFKIHVDLCGGKDTLI